MCVTIKIIFHYILIKKNLRIDVPSVTCKVVCCTDLQACVANDERSNRCHVKLSAMWQYSENPNSSNYSFKNVKDAYVPG